MLFVTLPFVVRTVQPVLLELDEEMEQAARSLGASDWQTFRRVVFPNVLPGILSGVALAFAKAVGEFGSLVIITGNLPFKTQVSSVFIFSRIESGDRAGAAAVVRRPARDLVRAAARDRRHPPLRDEARPWLSVLRRFGLRGVAFTYLAAILLGPLALVFYRTFENGFGAAWDALSTPETVNAFKLTLIITAIAVPLNTIFGIAFALAIVRRRFRGKGLMNAFVDLPLALSPVVVGPGARSCSTAATAGSASSATTGSRCSSRCPRW